MSKLVDGVPDFLYKPAAIDPQLFPAIQSEAHALFLKMYNQVEHNDRIFYYFEDFKNQIGNLAVYCPILVSELQRLNIYDLFDRVLFVQNYYNQERPMPVHRDHSAELASRFKFNHLGLNIPVRGYKGSCTIFYEGEVYDNNTHWREEDKGTENARTAPLAKPETVREIARVETTGPMWLNTWVLHAGHSDSAEPRLILSLRFNDMQHLFDTGYFDEHLVAN